MPTPTLLPVDFFKALAEDTRFYMLMLLTLRGELCVCDLMAALDESQPKVSRHLALLRQQGILQDRRQGHWVYYQLHPKLPDWAKQILSDTARAHQTYLNKTLPHGLNACASCE